MDAEISIDTENRKFGFLRLFNNDSYLFVLDILEYIFPIFA